MYHISDTYPPTLHARSPMYERVTLHAVYKQKESGPGGDPTLGPMLKSLHSGSRGGGPDPLPPPDLPTGWYPKLKWGKSLFSGIKAISAPYIHAVKISHFSIYFFFLVNIFIQDDMDTCTQHGRVTGVKVAS